MDQIDEIEIGRSEAARSGLVPFLKHQRAGPNRALSMGCLVGALASVHLAAHAIDSKAAHLEHDNAKRLWNHEHGRQLHLDDHAFIMHYKD